MAKEFADAEIKAHKVMVFSATYCPYCTMAKDALTSTGTKFHVVELDKRGILTINMSAFNLTVVRLFTHTQTADGDAILEYLGNLTGADTVPRVFIGQKFVGGGTDVRALQQQGKLVPLLKEAGAL